MRKSTIASCIIISGLLLFCVLTLLAVYGTKWETPTVLLEDTFRALDEDKWTHEVSQCRAEGDHFRYYKAGEEIGLAADGMLHVRPPASDGTKLKREATTECPTCFNCSSSLFSARIRSRSVFEARSGRLEIRAKFRKGDWMRFRIGLVSNDSNEEGSRGLSEKSHFEVIFESAVDRIVLKSEIPDEDFHLYEIDWDSTGTRLSVDHRKVDEASAGDGKSPPTAPFHLTLGADLGGRLLENPEGVTDGGGPSGNFLELDYVKLYGGN